MDCSDNNKNVDSVKMFIRIASEDFDQTSENL